MKIDRLVAAARRLVPWFVAFALCLAHAAPGDPADATDSDGDGAPDEVETNTGLDPAFRDNDIFGSARLFVMQQYRDFLSRESDAAGTEYWVGAMVRPAAPSGSPMARATLVRTFLESAEFAGVVAPVARLYFAYFLRIPDHEGLKFWILRHRSGEPLASISDAFASSAEFAGRYGALANREFVERVYSNVLGRPPDSPGLAYWAGRLDAGMTRGQLMLEFSEAPEYRSLIGNEIYVTLLYSGMLRRAPDPGGFAYWVGAMDDGASVMGLIDLFVGSAEYRDRFLQARPAGGAPEVKQTWPLDTAEGMSVVEPITAMFSEPMDPATIHAGTFTLSGPGGPVAATVSYASNTATLVPNERLLTEARYTATLTTGARDSSGSGLSRNHVFAFTTTADEPPPVVAGCPAPPAGARVRRLEWGATPILRQRSGAITAFRIPQSRIGRASVSYTQGQAAPSPPSPTIELTVSRCPGVIEEGLHPSCRLKTTFSNFVSITAFNRPLTESGLYTQEDHASLGCLAPAASGQHYVNVRWTFPSCPFGADQCGFSLQWGEGSY